MSDKVMQVELGDLVQRENSRQVYNEGTRLELMASLKQQGQLSPIGIKVDAKKNKWEVVYGNRRLIAAKKLGWKTIGCVFCESVSSKTELLIANITENLVRENPSLVEQGIGFEELRKAGLTVREIAVRIGVNPGKVQAGLDAFKHVPEEFRDKIRPSKIGIGGKSAGSIAGHTAVLIGRAIKDSKIFQAQARRLYEMAASGESIDKIRKAIKRMQHGDDEKTITERHADTSLVNVRLLIKVKKLSKHAFKNRSEFRAEATRVLKARFSDMIV